MTDFCLICECEPIEPEGWLYDPVRCEAICPWCINDMRKIKREKE